MSSTPGEEPAEKPLDKPVPWMKGMVPTLNQRGFMAETLDRFSMAFVEYAAICGHEALDMGCAYGVATREVLVRGGRVLACDMEAGHLEILEREMPEEYRDRLRTQQGLLPHVDFDEQAFGAILASRIVHFLDGDELRLAFAKMFSWLKPGGRAFIIADVAPLLNKTADELPDDMFRFLNPLDPDILAREAERAGFTVEEAAFTGSGGNPDGNEHAGLIALRP